MRAGAVDIRRFLKPTATEWGHSRWETLEKCPKLYELRYVHHIRPLAQPRGAAIGTAVHRGLAAAYWRRMKPEREEALPPDFWRSVVDAGRESIDVKFEAIRLVAEHERYWSDRDEWFDKVVGVERLVQTEVDGVPYSTRIDLVGKRKLPILVDHKTSARMADDAGTEWEMSGQFMGILAVWPGKRRPSLLVNLIVKTAQPQFRRIPISISDYKVARWKRDLKALKGDLDRYTRKGRFPRRYSACWTRYGQCVHPDTQVYLCPSLQPVPVSEIKVGDVVLTHEGLPGRVRAAVSRSYKGDLVRIQVMGCPERLLVTPDHPVLAANRIRYSRTSRGYPGHDKFIANEPTWIAAQDLRDLHHTYQNHNLVLPSIIGTKTMTASFRKVDPIGGRGKNIRSTKVDQTFARLIGYYVSEGSIDNNKKFKKDYPYRVGFSFGIWEKKLHREVVLAVRALGLSPTVSHDIDHNTTCIRVSSVALASYFKSACCTGASNKRFPDGLLLTDKKILLEAVRAAWLGDGTVKRFPSQKGLRRMVFTTTSKVLAHQMRLALVRLGVTSALYAFPPPIGRQQVLLIAVCGSNAMRLTRLFRLRVVARGGLFQRMKILKSGTMAMPIKKIDTVPYNGLVYDLDVERDHSFTTTVGVVHNCEMYALCHAGSGRAAEYYVPKGTKLGEVLK